MSTELLEQTVEEEVSELVCECFTHAKWVNIFGIRTRVNFDCTIQAVAILGLRCMDRRPLNVCEAMASSVTAGFGDGVSSCDECKRPLADCWYLTRF